MFINTLGPARADFLSALFAMCLFGQAHAQEASCEFPMSEDPPSIRCLTRAEATGLIQDLNLLARGEARDVGTTRQSVIAALARTYGPDHPVLSIHYCAAGLQQVRSGQFNDGVEVLSRGLQIALRRYGQDGVNTGHCLHSAGNAYFALARASQTTHQREEYLQGAEGYFRMALQIFSQATPRSSYELTEAAICHGLAATLIMAGRQDEVRTLVERADAIERRRLAR